MTPKASIGLLHENAIHRSQWPQSYKASTYLPHTLVPTVLTSFRSDEWVPPRSCRPQVHDIVYRRLMESRVRPRVISRGRPGQRASSPPANRALLLVKLHRHI